MGRAEELEELLPSATGELDSAQAAREAGLTQCRRAIRAAGSAVRAVHRLDTERATSFLGQSEQSLRKAQEVLSPFPAVAHAGFLHDAEKEFAEAALTAALVAEGRLPSHTELRVGLPAWLNGLAEAASELRRHILDRLRVGELDKAQSLFATMEDVYDFVVLIDYPDALTGGLRRTADALRAVLERTRSDLTTTLLQFRLQQALERNAGGAAQAPR